jgi:CDP-4-dehydro-6-deoxyglucose reductase, E3
MRLTVSGNLSVGNLSGGNLSGGDHSGDLEFRPGETVLHTLARHGIGLPAACRAGVCRACLLRVVRGDPGPAGRAGLEDGMRAEGYFLACLARPSADLTVALAAEDTFTPARLLSATAAGAGVIRVRVRPRRPLEFRAGQHVAVCTGPMPTSTGPTSTGPTSTGHASAGLVRVYSIANLPSEARRDGIEFQVRVYPGGAMSGWLASAAPGAAISLGRPAGTCCYRAEDPGRPLLLAGTGTGIAPLTAILRDALAQGHRGPVIIIRGAADPDGRYADGRYPDGRYADGRYADGRYADGRYADGRYADGRYPDGRYPEQAPGAAWPSWVRSRTCLVSRGEDVVAAAVDELSGLAEPASARAYLCGGPRVVARMHRALFMAGLSLRRIHCDEFTQAVAE